MKETIKRLREQARSTHRLSDYFKVGGWPRSEKWNRDLAIGFLAAADILEIISRETERVPVHSV